MGNRLRRFQKARTLVLGAATLTLLWLPGPAGAQSSATQDRPAVQTDDITHRDLARFDQFLDSHRAIASQLRKTPSLVDDPQFLQSHPELNAYLQEHPSVKQEISQRPDTFMSLEDRYARDRNLRDRDAGGQDRDADRGDVANRDADRRDVTDRDADRGGAADRDADRRDNADRRDVANFDRFLDGHREIAEQVRKDPSLLDNRNFVQNHPALQAYLQDNPGVRDQLRQNPNAFMRQEDAYDRASNMRDRDPMHDHMADFGGFLRSHADIRRDLSRDPSVVKDHEYVQNHGELYAYLNAHPDVRAELMANPQDFVHGAQRYGGAPGSAGVNGRGTGTTGAGTGMTGSSPGTSTNPATTTHESPKPNQ